MISSGAQRNTNQDNASAIDVMQNNIAETEPDNDGCIPTATSSCISISMNESNNATPKINDTTQEFNLEAFSSDLEEMDKLEFAPSDSPTSTAHSDSGNITANTSSVITAENCSVNQTADACQTTTTMNNSAVTQLLGDVNSTSELAITSTASETETTSEMEVETFARDGQSMNVENEQNCDHPEPSSTSQDTFVRVGENSETNCTFELNSSSEVSHAGSSIFKVQTDKQAQENIVSTSNEAGVVAEPSNDYVESAQNIRSMATCSTPARAIGKFDTRHSFVGPMQQNVAQQSNVQCLSTQLDASAATLSILSKCEDPMAEQEIATQIDDIELATQIIQKNTVSTASINESNSLASKELDISHVKDTSTILEFGQIFEDIGSTRIEYDTTATNQKSQEVVSIIDDSQSKFHVNDQ